MRLLKINRVYPLLVLLPGIFILFFSAFILSFSREAFIIYIMQTLQRHYLWDILRNKIITPEKFLLIRYLCFGLIMLDAVSVLLLFLFRKKIINFFGFVSNTVGQALNSIILVFKKSSKKENIIFIFLLVFIIARGLYYIIITDLQYDEIWCYNYYTSRPVYLNFFTLSTYPLYEIITHVFKWLPFSMKINLRLPSLLSGLCACIIIYSCTKKINGNFLTAIACTALFAAMPFSTCYMLYAKGVMTALFFAIASFFSLIFFLKEISCKKYLMLFVIANIAGIYSMPTHIYYWALQFAVSAIYILYFKKKLLKLFLFANIIIIVLSFFCYMPVMIGSGTEAITSIASGSFRPPDLWPGFVSFIKYLNYAFTGNNYGLVIALLIAAVILLINKKHQKELFFILSFGVSLFLLPFPVRIFQHFYIPERSVAFIGLIIPLSAFIIFFAGKNFVKEYILSVALIMLFVVTLIASHFHSFRSWSAKPDRNAIVISELLMLHHVINCYDNAPASHFFYYYPSLEYYYGIKKMNIELLMAAQKSLRYKPFSPADNYDCIVDTVNAGNKNGYENIYNNAEENFKILLRKGK